MSHFMIDSISADGYIYLIFPPLSCRHPKVCIRLQKYVLNYKVCIRPRKYVLNYENMY